MRERIRPTRSGLFAIELVVAVGVFTLCAAICTGIFAQSEVMSQDSADLTRAVNEARNAAERFKASNGDLARMAERFGGRLTNDNGTAVLSLSYGEDWTLDASETDGATSTPTETGAAYEIRLTAGAGSPGCAEARLQAFRYDGTILLDWEIAALEAVS